MQSTTTTIREKPDEAKQKQRVLTTQSSTEEDAALVKGTEEHDRKIEHVRKLEIVSCIQMGQMDDQTILDFVNTDDLEDNRDDPGDDLESKGDHHT